MIRPTAWCTTDANIRKSLGNTSSEPDDASPSPVTLRGNQRNGEKTKNNWVLRFVIFGVPKGERRVNRCAETGIFFFTILIWRRWCWCHTSFGSTLKTHHTQSITMAVPAGATNKKPSWKLSGWPGVFFGWRQKKNKTEMPFSFSCI